jgi:hypothetical protein
MFIRIYLRDRGTASGIGLDEQSAGGVDHGLGVVLNFVWSPAVPVTFSQRPDCPARERSRWPERADVSAAGADEEGGDDVGGVAVERDPRPVIVG